MWGTVEDCSLTDGTKLPWGSVKGTVHYYDAWKRTGRERLLKEYRGLVSHHPKYAEASGKIKNTNGPDKIQWREPQFPLSTT